MKYYLMIDLGEIKSKSYLFTLAYNDLFIGVISTQQY